MLPINLFILIKQPLAITSLRLNALGLSICLSVCLFVCLSVCRQKYVHKSNFLIKLNNLELWCLLTTYRKSYRPLWAFQRTLKFKMVEIAILKIGMTSFFCHGESNLDEIWQIGAEWHADCGDMVEIETRIQMVNGCFSKPWSLSRGLRYVDEIWFADRCWPSKESDIIKYETGSSMEPPRPPSWNCIWRHYSAARGPIWTQFGIWCRRACRLQWYGRSCNRKKNFNMADVCLSKPEVVISQV